MCDFTNKNNDFIIYLDGDIDHYRAELLRDAIDKTLCGLSDARVIFDLSGVDFMDSSGIGFLIGRYKCALANGCMVSLRNPLPQVDKMLEMAGLYKIMRKE